MRQAKAFHSRIARLALFAGILLAVPPAAGPARAAPGEFSECSGAIEEAASGRAVTFMQLAGRVAEADHVLFGERHGVKAQATASSCILSAMARDDRPVSIVMEMLSRDDDGTIERYRRNHPETPAGLGVELRWWTRGWPAFDNWLPLVERAFSLRAPLLGGDLPEGDARPRKLTPQEGEAAARRLGSDVPAIHDSWKRAMVAAHCGLIPPAQAEIDAGHQIRRDLSMADSAGKARASNHRVLLQVGRGHSRKDRSLYRALSHGKASVLSVGAFVEGETVGQEERKLYDYLWIVGKADLADPCTFTGSMNRKEEPASR